MILSEVRRLRRRFLTEAQYVPQTIALVWGATRGWTTAWLALLVAQGLLPVAAVYLTKGAVDALLTTMSSGIGAAAIPVIIAKGAPLATVMLLQVVGSAATRWVRFHQSEILHDYITRTIHEKSVSVRLSFYDFPEYDDRLHRARDEASYRPVALLEVTGALLQNLVTTVGVAAVLIPYGIWLPITLLLGSTPSVLLVFRNSLKRQQWRRDSTSAVRRTHYFEWLVTTREAAAEIRLFDIGGEFIEAYQALRRRLVTEQAHLVRREALAEIVAAALSLAVAGSVGAWVVWEALTGRLTAGTLAMFFAAFMQAQRLMRSVLNNAAQLYMNSLFLGDLFEFLRLETEAPRITSRAPAVVASLRQGIRLERVNFAYPAVARQALTNFSLDVAAGRTVAIVGPNGAGKSTILKLLCRFYEPTSGRILIDGRDIADRSPAEVRQLMSVLFQEPVRYSALVKGNVIPGFSFERTPTAAGRPQGVPYEQSQLEAAVHAAGAEEIVARLPHGYDTLLGKWFDEGVELSGGEWQRLALARAFARDTPILLLDEPTSAMDSWAEAEWFDRLRQATAARTTIIITHRFTTAMQADIIHVMDDGRIAESGTHEELLSRAGRYAESWHAQTRERVG